MSHENMLKQILLPAKVPWQVSPSTPFLRLVYEENRILEIVFVANYLGEELDQSCGDKSIKMSYSVTREFESESGVSRGPCRLVKIIFDNGLWMRSAPSFSDSEVIEEASFDWSNIDGVLKGGEDVGLAVERIKNMWINSNICPDSRFYEVGNSIWLDELNIVNDPNNLWRHFLILGHDCYIEVVASAWRYEEGRLVSG